MIRTSLLMWVLCLSGFACRGPDEVIYLGPQDLIEYELQDDQIVYFQVQDNGERLPLVGDQVPDFVRESVQAKGEFVASSGAATACLCVKGRLNSQPSRDNTKCDIDRLWKCGCNGANNLVQALKDDNHFDTPAKNREASRPSFSEISLTE